MSELKQRKVKVRLPASRALADCNRSYGRRAGLVPRSEQSLVKVDGEIEDSAPSPDAKQDRTGEEEDTRPAEGSVLHG